MYIDYKRVILALVAILILMNTGAVIINYMSESTTSNEEVSAQAINDSLKYTFNIPGVLNEAGTAEESTSPYFWLTAGGQLLINDGTGKTIHGGLDFENEWRKLYGKYSSLDTDEGRYPQNIFRLVTKGSVGDAEISVLFRINSINYTKTPNRGAWSGIFIMSRYKDSDNLYYSGIRQDGHAVIKKKINGVYYTLVEKPIFTDSLPYDADVNPNLLPGKKWMTLLTSVVNKENGVEIRLYLDQMDDNGPELLVQTIDTDKNQIHSTAGRTGVRSDYMDIELDDFSVKVLN